MCISQEASLIAGGTMIGMTVWTYTKYVSRTLPEPPPSTPARSETGPTPVALCPAMRSMAMTHMLIGLHLVMSAAAQYADSYVLHKLSLALSIFAPYAALVSLELLTKRNFASPVVLALAASVTVTNAFIPMETDFSKFCVRGEGYFPWGITSVGLIVYWNVCLFHARSSSFSPTEGALLRWYGWSLMNISSVAALGFAFFVGFRAHVAESIAPLSDHSSRTATLLLQDVPFLWNILAVVQVFVLPFSLRAINKGYVHNLPPSPANHSMLFNFGLALAAALFTALLYGVFPIAHSVAESILPG